MNSTITIGIIGDYDEKKVSHPATNEAIKHAIDYLHLNIKFNWLPTNSFLAEKGLKSLLDYDAIWASSGSPYDSLDGAINAIRIARESGKPFIGT
jgi:CTP synthase (UTP-ammonia lyase)